jgi:glucokinase
LSRYFGGIDLGGTKILTVVTDESRNTLAKVKIATESAKGVDHVITNMFSSLEQCCNECKIELSDLAGIGIGVPGPVNFEKGMVYDCPNLHGWKNIEVREMFEKKFNVSVVVENDARVAGLAEVRIGSAKGFRHVFYVTVSTGIGGALIFDGKIYHGADGAAGEFGQMRLLDGTIFEQRYAGPAIERIFGISTHQIPELIRKNDPGAEKALDHLITGLGIYLSNITTLLNPEIIVMGGGVSSLGDLLLKPLEQEIRKQGFSISSKNVKIVRAGLGTDSGAIGAVELLFDD